MRRAWRTIFFFVTILGLGFVTLAQAESSTQPSNTEDSKKSAPPASGGDSNEMKVELKPAETVGASESSISSAPSPATNTNKDSRCQSIPEDLKSMREAQEFLLQSMVRKNESLADTLEIFAKEFSSKKTRLKPNDIKRMNRSAQAFRGHALRERGLVERFESSTAGLVKRIEKCLIDGALANVSE